MTNHSSPVTADREQIAAVLYVTRFPHRTWLTASLDETALAYKQADAILSIPAQEARVPKVRTSHHRNKEEAARLQELVDKRYAPAQCAPNAAAQFVMWCLMEGCWQGADIDGGAAQDEAEALGLIVQTQYDPVKHGESEYCDPGDVWYVPSPALLAALGDASPVTSTDNKARCNHWPGQDRCGVCGMDNTAVTRPDGNAAGNTEDGAS